MNQPEKRELVRPLAVRQREMLILIVRFTNATGESPSVAFLARKLGIHHKTAQEHIEALYQKGWLETPSPQGIRCAHEPS